MTLDAGIDSDEGMSNLRARIAELAAGFADRILAEIRTASFQELAGHSRRGRAPVTTRAPRRKRVRRTAADLQRTLDTIVALVAKKPGLRSEQIQAALRLSKKDVTRPITLGLQAKVLAKKGVKRATTYYSK